MDHLKGVLFVDRVSDEGNRNRELKDHGFLAADVRPLV
jgi:peptide deformylase